MELRIAGITRESVVDGPGIRMVVFTQGCPHACHGCHNPHTHDPNGGRLIKTSEILTLVENTKLIRGVTFSGGEPFLQPRQLAYLAKEIRRKGLDIVTYTGFVFEELLAMAVRLPHIKDLIKCTDILIDGPYRAAERDLRLAFRGSHNQRLIDIQSSLRKGKVVLWEDPAARICI